jgi:probable HAF family extracellular repeat protein
LITVATIPPLGSAANPIAIFGLAFGSSDIVAAGWSGRDGQFVGPHAISWTLAGGIVDLGSLGTGEFDYSNGYAISEYGDVVVGTSGSPNTTFQAPTTAFRYTVADNTMRDLGSLTPGNPVSAAYDVNFDGSVVVGSANIGSIKFPTTHAFRWVQTPGQQTGTMTDIDNDPLSFSSAYAVNDDGSVVVGVQSQNNQASQTSGFIWKQATGMVKLGALPGDTAAMATGVSRDGTIVVGTSDPNQVFNPFTNTAQTSNRPFRWTQATGMQDLNALANAAGLNPTGFVFQNATGISRDGTIIYGNGVDAQGNPGAYTIEYCGGSCDSPLVAAILPASRSVEVGGAPATAFATIINTGSTAATGCSVQPPEGVTANFTYQTTSATTNGLVGTANTPVSLAPNAAQSFVFAFAPTAAFAPIDLPLVFNCIGQFAVAPQSGLNTLLISASTTPVPDVVALGATTSNDGVLHITGTRGSAAFAVATVDVGAGGTITATANTGSATLPLALSLCQTDPTSGACLAPPSASVMATIAANATPTFGIFGTASGAIAFDPANSRIFVQFTDSGGAVRGETSVAVETQ